MGLRPNPGNQDYSPIIVTPAQAGVHIATSRWIPAFAGMMSLG